MDGVDSRKTRLPTLPTCLPQAGSLYDDADGQTTMLALFSMINWPCFQLSRFKRHGPIGPVFDDQLALFSVDKNNTYSPGKEVYLFDKSIWFGRRVVNNVSDLVARWGYRIFLNGPVCRFRCKAKFAAAPNL